MRLQVLLSPPLSCNPRQLHTWQRVMMGLALRSSSPRSSAAPSARRASHTSGGTPAITFPRVLDALPAAAKSSPSLPTFATSALGLGPVSMPKAKGVIPTATPLVIVPTAPSAPLLRPAISAQGPKGGVVCALGRSGQGERRGRPPGFSQRPRQGGKRWARGGGGPKKFPGRLGEEGACPGT